MTEGAPMPGNRGMLKRLIQLSSIFALSGFLVCAHSADSYNSANNQLTIPQVLVGNTTYSNVVVTVGSVISVGAAPALGAYDTYDGATLTIPAVSANGTAYYNVKVTVGGLISVGGQASTVTFSTDADFVAYQVGTGPWQKAVGDGTVAMKSYAFNLDSTAKYGVALVCAGTSSNTVRISHHSGRETLKLSYPQCPKANILTGAVSGLTGTDRAIFFVTGGTTDWSNTASYMTNGASFSMTTRINATVDIVGVEVDDSYVPQKYLIARNVNVSGNLSGLNVDFSRGVAASPRTLTVVGGNTGSAPVGWLYTSNGTAVWLDPQTSAGPTKTLYLPIGATVSDDSLTIEAYEQTAGGQLVSTVTTSALIDPGNQNIDLSTVAGFPAAPTVDFLGALPRISGLSYAPGASSPPLRNYRSTLVQTRAGTRNTYTVAVSPGWLGSGNALTLPSLDSISGWNTNWNLASGTATSYSIIAEMTSYAYAQAVENSLQRAGTRLLPGVYQWVQVDGSTP
jgi:hypothetical protein